MANYGPPILDFSPIANLGSRFLKARRDADEHEQKQEIRQTLASLGTGNSDYDTIGRKLLSMGELNGGLGFLKLGQEEKLRGAQAAADRAALGLAFGGGSDPTYAPAAGTPRANVEGGVHIAETEDDVQRLERAMGQNVAPDLDKVVRTIYGEAGNQGVIGQAAVANVIANRAQQSGMTPTDVVLAKGQFEPWSDPAARARMEALDPSSPEYQQLARIAENALTGRGADPTGGATHFYAPKAQAALGRNAPSWDDGTGRDIGDHRFFAHGYGPQGKVQVAQADVPAAGAREAQGFAIPGQGGAQSPRIANIERALASPNLSDNARRALQSRLDREYKLLDETRKAEAEAPVTREIKQPDGSEVVVQWDKQSRSWKPMPAPEGGATVQGPVKLTETQSKDVGFYNRGSRIIDRLEKQDQALTDALSKVGGNVSNYFKTPQYRQAEQTAREFLAVLLRKDTGAAVTPQEMEMYSSIYLPQPADDPTTIEQKKAARRTALEGIRLGLGTAEIIFSSQEALQNQPAPTAPSTPTQTPAPQGTAPVEGARRAPDGNWYVPDPNRPGKYLQVQ